MLNRCSEALLAYAIAEQGVTFAGSQVYQLHERIRAEQTTCQSDAVRSEMVSQLRKNIPMDQSVTTSSIFHPAVMTTQVTKQLFDTISWSETPKFNPNQSRAMELSHLGIDSVPWQDRHRLQLNESTFSTDDAWPIPFDPFFAAANVASGRPPTPTYDLSQITKQQVRKAPALSHRGMDAFTCRDLAWLVRTVRECLTSHQLDWTESPEGFHVSYRAFDAAAGVAARHSFAISLFRLALRSGYGVDVCRRGICSSRVRSPGPGVEQGVPRAELVRIRSTIRRGLDAALAKREVEEETGGGGGGGVVVVPFVGVASTSMHSISAVRRDRGRVEAAENGRDR
jgi:hypothetical protein